MPGGDRTGPRGAGPMTGRAAGYCAGYATPGYANLGPGRVFGRGCGGGGRGYRNQFYATGLPGWIRAGNAPVGVPYPQAAPVDELNLLKQQAQTLNDQLAAVNKRLNELEKE